MAVEIHVVRIGERKVNSMGQVINKNQATVNEVLAASTEDRVLADLAIPNSANFPAVKEYLELEAIDDFVLSHIDQTMIVTYKT